MHLERLAYNKLKIYLTLEDLLMRGLDKDDFWKDTFKWQMFFIDLLEEVSLVYGINIEGSVAVEIFSVNSQGMIVILTFEEVDDYGNSALYDGQFEWLSGEQTKPFLYEFSDIEDIIRLSHRLHRLEYRGGILYHMNEKYFLYVEKAPLKELGKIQANMAEFGQVSLENIVKLQEYGKLLIGEKAIEALVHYFK